MAKYKTEVEAPPVPHMFFEVGDVVETPSGKVFRHYGQGKWAQENYVSFETSPGGGVELFPEEARAAIAALGGTSGLEFRATATHLQWRTTETAWANLIAIADIGGGGAGGPAGPALIVAAADAPAQMKATAHYVCTGTDDHLVIEQAIADLPAGGGTVQLTPGTFNGHVRIRKGNTRLLGSGWGTVVRIQANATLKNNDCPIRVFADGCYVGHLTVDGNKSNQSVSTSPIENVREFDGVAIYANNCLVEFVRARECHGHHFIVWNDDFPAEGVPSAARYGNTVQYCWVMDRGSRNSMDYASTKDLGENVDQKINYGNTMRGNVLLNGANIVVHTGWDTLVEGNIVLGGGTIGFHTNSRRVMLRNNIVVDAAGTSIQMNGGINGAEQISARRSRDCVADGNIVRNSVNTGLAVVNQDGARVRNNVIDGTTSHCLSYEDCTDLRINLNTLRNPGGGALPIRNTGTTESIRSVGVTVEDNSVEGGSGYCMEFRMTTGLRVIKNRIRGGTRGVELLNGVIDASVDQNDIANGNGPGVNVGAATTNVRVRNNDIVGTTGNSCVHAAGTGVVVQRNYCRGGARAVRLGADCIAAVVTDNICSDHTSAAISLPQADSVIRRNVGFVTEASGTATVPSGSTSVTVTHGLGITPRIQDIRVTPTNNLGTAAKFWISAAGATTFVINVDADPGATTATFAWSHERLV